MQFPVSPGTQQAPEPHYDFSEVKVIVSLDSDFLFCHPAGLAYARQFAKGRNAVAESPDPTKASMSRLYVAEPTPSITGTMADHRIACSATDIQILTEAIAQMHDAATLARLPKAQQDWLAAVTKDLDANHGSGLVLAGEGQPVLGP